MDSTLESVKDYYGKVLKTKEDLKTTVCTTGSAPSEEVRQILSTIHEEVLEKYYGCGSIFPSHVKGLKVLDLGCGSGRDCYVFSKLVGETGEVYGLDMTPEQLEVANKHIDYQTKKFGYSKPNVHFVQGFIEDLDAAGLPDNYFDLIISNCVVNLSPKKDQVLSQAYKKLKEGGEMFFSDIYSNRRVPQSLREDSVLWGECISGALYWFDYQTLWKKAGFNDSRIVSFKEIGISSPTIRKTIEKVSPNLRFYSVDVRLWKLSSIEPYCEDYGQAIRYQPKSSCCSHSSPVFLLDEEHKFEQGKIYPVCGNTFNILGLDRFKKDFQFFQNEPLQHYGIFPGCGSRFPITSEQSTTTTSSSTSCCSPSSSSTTTSSCCG